MHKKPVLTAYHRKTWHKTHIQTTEPDFYSLPVDLFFSARRRHGGGVSSGGVPTVLEVVPGKKNPKILIQKNVTKKILRRH